MHYFFHTKTRKKKPAKFCFESSDDDEVGTLLYCLVTNLLNVCLNSYLKLKLYIFDSVEKPQYPSPLGLNLLRILGNPDCMTCKNPQRPHPFSYKPFSSQKFIAFKKNQTGLSSLL